MKNFKQLKIWQNGFEIAVKAYRLIETFPTDQRFSLSRQITSAAVSIPSNIAEGSGRATERDYARFIRISMGSSFELETQLLIAAALNFGDAGARQELLRAVEKEHMMLHGFLGSLKVDRSR